MLYEKAVEYANDVINEKEITTPEVKKQCEWFLRDLQRQKNEEYPYYFDMDFAKKVEGLLKLMNFATGIGVVGKSIYEGMESFQAFLLQMFSAGDIKLTSVNTDTEKLIYLSQEKMQRHLYVH